MASSTTQPHPTAPQPPKRRHIELSSTKVIGSAGAAVTSAVGSGLFGATGTVAGAAVGSVISTVAGAVYERSLQNASEKLKETTVVVRKVPARNARPDAVPTDLPEVAAGAERQDPDTTEAITAPDVTTALPLSELRVAEQGEPAAQTLGGPGGGEPDGEKPVIAGFGRRRLLMLGAVMLAGFVIALGGMTILEKVLGQQLNGDRGTSIGTVTGTSTSTTDDEDTRPAEQEPEATPTGEPTASPDASESTEPDATSTPDTTDTATGEPSETSGPAESEAPGPEPTDDAQTGADGSEGSGGGADGAAPAPTGAPAND